MSEYENSTPKPTRELPPPPRSITGRPIPAMRSDPQPIPRKSRKAEGLPDCIIDEVRTQKGRDAIEDWIDLPKLRALVECHLRQAKRRTVLTPEQLAIVEANKGLAIAFATHFWRKAKRAGFDFGELVAAAHLGLEDAVAKFDPSRGRLGGLAWGYMTRRRVELHKSHDDDPKPKARNSRKVDRASRWSYEEFEWPPFPDVISELNRLASLPDGPFTHDDLDVLEARSRDGLSQHATAADLGISLAAVRRIEKRALERVGPVVDRLWEASTDRYLMKTLGPDEIRRIYGHQSDGLVEWQERNDALEAALERQASRRGYGRIG